MPTAIRALIWEMIWKNRVVFPALALLLLLGAGGIAALAQAPEDVWWAGYARGTILVAFLTSLLLGYAPFTLMENSPGWRMNSMTTRWFVLPLRTGLLVLVPLVFALGFITLLLGAWTLCIKRMVEDLDMVYMLVVFLAGIAALQALAWALPRRPGQFWFLAVLVFIAVLFLTIIPQDTPHWKDHRQQWLAVMVPVIPVLAGFAWLAARQNRRGNWMGEISVARLLHPIHWRWYRTRPFRSPLTALFWSETKPLLQAFVATWAALALLLIGWVCLLVFRANAKSLPHSISPLMMISFAALDMLPFLGVLWLGGYGLFAGCEPNQGFQTRLSAFRGGHPVTAGQLSGMRLMGLVLGWALIWLPLLAFTPFYDPTLRGMPDESLAQTLVQLRAGLAWKMALSAQVMAGAVPFMLLGRLAGFPVLILASLVTWVWSVILNQSLLQEASPNLPWISAIVLLSIKWVVALSALGYSWRKGHITWRFALALLLGWCVVTGSLIWVLPTWQIGGAWKAMGVALLVPLGRLAVCPLAVALNRHR